MIVDASVILNAYFPDETQEQAQALIRDHVIGYLQLEAPSLLLYEVTNAVLQARRRGRVSEEQADEILSSFDGLGIALKPVTWAPFCRKAAQVSGVNKSMYAVTVTTGFQRIS